MELKIFQADPGKDAAQVRALFWEYLQWANAKVNETFGVNFEIKTILDEDMLTLEKFMPPKGRLLLCHSHGEPAGVACQRDNGNGIGEIKRMFVREANRRQGIGHAMVSFLLEEARTAGYRCIRLDSAGFMKEAHRLYRTFGFREIDPYAESEIPLEFQVHWIFMEKVLD